MTTPLLTAADMMQRHPCFNEEAHQRVGRVHLPVAPRCNIQCAFCERRVCAGQGMQHPGWTQRLLSPDRAVRLVDELVAVRPEDSFVVGVAGPGDPLANAETFEALARIHQAHPALTKCVSTNGLVLEESLPQLLRVGVRALTVTVNAPDGEVGRQIYVWVRDQGIIHRGQEGAELLIARQMRGIRAALEAGLVVKVNTVLIPGVNDRRVAILARRLAEAGVRLMNIMPLIPCGHMRDIRAPTCDELQAARSECEAAVPQFRRCEHCSADVVYLPTGEGSLGHDQCPTT